MQMIQALTNYRNQSTGQLSVVTVFMLFLGSAARIFTSIQETGDQMVIATYCVTAAANGLIVFQMLWYWNSKAKGSPKKKPQANAGKANGGKGGKNASNSTANKKGSQKPKKK